jgi:hypothetical protein
LVDAGSKALSSSFGVGVLAVTEDDAAFKCQMSEALTGRTQTVLRGILTLTGFYKASGLIMRFERKLPRFPNANYRVILQVDNTATYCAVYNHSTSKILVYNAIGTEETEGTDLAGIIFPCLVIGE